MKILFIAPNYLPHVGGVEKHIDKLVQELLKDKNSVTIVVPKFDNNYMSYEKSNALEIFRVRKKSNKLLNRVHSLFYLLKNFQLIKENNIIHFHDYSTFWNFGLFAYFFIKLTGKKVYITFHGWEGKIPLKKSVILKRKIIEKLVDANICIGHFIEKWYATKADIVSYGGVDTVLNLEDTEEKYLLFIGRLAEDTAIWNYIKTWEMMNNINKNNKFIICGDGVLREELEQYVENKNIINIEFKGFVTDTQEYIKNANLIFTSGYLGILEAFSYKKNVISVYDNALKKDYLMMIPDYDNMMWVVDDTTKNIIKVVEEALNNDDKKEIAYKYSLKHSWKNLKEDYYKLWKM